MNQFEARQIAQMRFAIADYREGKMSLNILISRLEGAARAVGSVFLEENVFDIVLDLEQINAGVIEDRITLTSEENTQVEDVIARLECRLSQFDGILHSSKAIWQRS